MGRVTRTRLSAGALVIANAIPLLGVALWGWPLGKIMAPYWIESAIIGAFNVVKMLMISPVGGLFLGAFFCVHFGIFMLVHGMFVAVFFVADRAMDGGEAAPLALLALLEWEFWILLASHAFSFVLHWLLGNEREGRELHEQMMLPYGRIIVMHVTILIGGMLVLFLQEPLPVMALFVALKTAVDLAAHRREHLTPSPAAAPPHPPAP
ncbi:MAG: DUF6498-containing protein [Planctomycetota bacterium]|jgi:hypothetical protein